MQDEEKNNEIISINECDMLILAMNLCANRAELSMQMMIDSRPDRMDLIDNLREHSETLKYGVAGFRKLLLGYAAQSHRASDLELICLKQEIEIRKLTAQNERLLQGL